jgi:hypothetical protein
LWKERSKICNCFVTAKLAVEINHGKTQAEFFMLFKRKEHDETPKCYIYGNFQLGKPTFNSEKALLWDKPPKDSGFIGF